ncbi:MAG TPA: trypsin-like serine protease [Gemmatimonadaceae bacterium]|nr:trypsin-like serine protease [Gemmatimonadaceae bacterium]
MEALLSPGSFVLATVLSLNGPFFPASLVQPAPRADTRRCEIGAHATQSDCALIGAQWVVTSAGAVAAARATDGRLHVKIGDADYTVDQLVYHPKWNGGVKNDVMLIKLTDRVPSFPMLPPPGEFPANVNRIVERAAPHHDWVAQTIGPSPLWDGRATAALSAKQSPLVTRVRSLMDSWAGRTSND